MKRTMVFVAAVIVAMAAASFFPFASEAAAKKVEKLSIECPKLDKADAQSIINKVIPNGTVVDVREAPIKGLWEIEVQKDGQHGAVLLDCSRKYLIGQVVSLESIGKPRKVDVSKIPLDSAIVLGSREAAKKVIVITDPDCPFCRQLHPIMKQIIEKHGDIAFYLIFNPLPMHKDSPKKVQAILCSKSLAMLDDAFAGKAVPEPPASCPADVVEKGKEIARSMEFNSTPTLVRDDGTVLAGYLPEEKLLEWIDKK